MKLASAIEEFIEYKRALGSPYISPARVLKAFLRKTGDLDLDALTTQHSDAFLPAPGGMVTSAWFQRYWVLDRFLRFARGRGYIQHIEYSRPPCPIGRRVSFPTSIRPRMSVG